MTDPNEDRRRERRILAGMFAELLALNAVVAAVFGYAIWIDPPPPTLRSALLVGAIVTLALVRVGMLAVRVLRTHNRYR